MGAIHSVPVCCPFCERAGLSLSFRGACNCSHNGRNPHYQPTAEELREVEEFKRQLTGRASSVGHVTGGSVIFVIVLLSVLTQETVNVGLITLTHL